MNGYDGQESFLGLGFSHNSSQETLTPSTDAIDAAESLMKHYLQQCLEFHEEQQQQHVQEDAIPQFVTAQHLPPAPPNSQIPTGVSSAVVATNEHESTTSSVSNHDPLSNPSAQEAIARAQAIVQKFQQQQQHQQQEHHFSLSTFATTTTILPSDYRHRRQQQLLKEQERLHKATLKNFEYVAKREEERLKLQLEQLQQTRTMEQELHQQHQAFLQSRKEKQLQSKAGIGTSRRQALEKSKQRQGHVVQQQNDSTIAIYISGLPTATVTEDLLGQLFSSYGNIRRVHLYRNKQTGQLKGDGLVVYNVKKESEKQDILNAACSQMNGAELPCGSILHVEPADANYKQRQSGSNEITTRGDEEVTNYYGPASKIKENKEMPTVVENGCDADQANTLVSNPGDKDDDDDLDDFFDSL